LPNFQTKSSLKDVDSSWSKSDPSRLVSTNEKNVLITTKTEPVLIHAPSQPKLSELQMKSENALIFGSDPSLTPMNAGTPELVSSPQSAEAKIFSDEFDEDDSLSMSESTSEYPMPVENFKIVTSPVPDENTLEKRRLEEFKSMDSMASFGSMQSIVGDASGELTEEQLKEKAEKKRKKRLATRRLVLAEIISTEESYLQQLGWLLNLYKRPLAGEEIVGMSLNKHNKIFPSVLDTLFTLNTKFLEDLRQCCKEFDEASVEGEENQSNIGKVFSDFTPFFKMYLQYVQLHDQARTALEKVVGRNAKFVEYENKMMSQTNNLNLNNLLITPIQRLPRYELLLRELLKNTSESNKEYKDLKTCYTKVQGVNAVINVGLKDFEQRQKLIQIEKKFTKKLMLTSPSRKFKKQGEIFKITSRKKKADTLYTFFLFNDLVLYAKPKGEKQFVLHQELPINSHFEIHDLPDTDKQNRFQIISTKKSITCYCKTLGDKQSWLESIRESISDSAASLSKDDGVSGVAPLWKADDDSNNCTQCHDAFTFFNRRHHCRFCGDLVCGKCSTHKLPYNNDPKKIKRACDLCQKDYDNIKRGVNLSKTRASTLRTKPIFYQRALALSNANTPSNKLVVPQ